MAIGLVVFNPAKSKRMLMNALYVWNYYKTKGLPVFVLELVFGDNEPEFKKAFHVRGESPMFHKERLCRLLEQRIPRKYKKLAFLDADVLFPDDSWYEETSDLLDDYDVVQPFLTADWLDLSYKKAEVRRSLWSRCWGSNGTSPITRALRGPSVASGIARSASMIGPSQAAAIHCPPRIG